MDLGGLRRAAGGRLDLSPRRARSAAVDPRRPSDATRDGFVATEGWRETSATRADELLQLVEASPLFAVVYTDIATDGMMAGPNFEATLALKASTALPVIASGGVTTLDHVARLRAEGVFGCIIGRALYEVRIALPDALSP